MVLGACGAPPPAVTPPAEIRVESGPPDDGLSPSDRELHVADAFAELTNAERVLDETLAPTQTKVPPGPRAPTHPNDSAASGATPPSTSSATNPGCETACLALQSMRRSARFLCRLTGPGDERCSNANARVAVAERRVAAASCACATRDG